MNIRSLFAKSLRAQIVCGLLIALASLGLTSCHTAAYYYYYFPQYTYANRPVPPSRLANRVMVSFTANGSTGQLQMLDGLRDIRNNVQNTIFSFPIAGYASGYPSLIMNFPAELRGYVYSNSDGSVAVVDYSKETSASTGGATFAPNSSVAVPATFTHLYAAIPSAGLFEIYDPIAGKNYGLSIPNVNKAFVNTGDSVVLAMALNSNIIYRVVLLNQNQFQTAAQAIATLGAVDCQPLNNPVYCAVPVASPQDPANLYDRPQSAYFSLDGSSVYILNCGPECGGQTASVTTLQTGPLNINNIPTSPVYSSVYQSQTLTPGGATVALSDGSTLYVAGQKLLPDGLFTGNLTTISLATQQVTGTYGISDGTHTRLLFADDNTLWIGSSRCANGERAKLNQNYNCLTRFDLGSQQASILPNVTPGSSSAVVPYPNADNNMYYYGDLTGLCWVQNLHKVYTAYGGQVHAFNTADGSEINNFYITVQGTALDVAYMDAVTDAAD
ncbi:MAG: hypothetical protein KGK08_08080 [Acidobacteriota bacterium]|nr:hypothetical protein [Acidobacteriota bacterium]